MHDEERWMALALEEAGRPATKRGADRRGGRDERAARRARAQYPVKASRTPTAHAEILAPRPAPEPSNGFAFGLNNNLLCRTIGSGLEGRRPIQHPKR